MNQKDQYNKSIPQDLTLLDYPIGELTDGQIKKIDSLDWYCFEGNKTDFQGKSHIFVSCVELEKVLDSLLDEENSPDDIGVGKNWEIVKIDHVLHRWNLQDGFYWA